MWPLPYVFFVVFFSLFTGFLTIAVALRVLSQPPSMGLPGAVWADAVVLCPAPFGASFRLPHPPKDACALVCLEAAPCAQGIEL